MFMSVNPIKTVRRQIDREVHVGDASQCTLGAALRSTVALLAAGATATNANGSFDEYKKGGSGFDQT
jgi:hypothetical protein